MRLQLEYSSVIQGEFKLSSVNIMLVMQVNCPGCFQYAIPALIRLKEELKDAASFSILSTAFEDFEWNTEENTRRLVEHGEIVDETKRVLGEHYGLDRYHHAIPFTVMFDKIVDKGFLLRDDILSKIVNLHCHRVSAENQPEFSKVLRDHYQSLGKAGYTFAANLLPGTPTFLVFDGELEIMYSWFGHKDLNEIIKTLRAICALPDDQ